MMSIDTSNRTLPIVSTSFSSPLSTMPSTISSTLSSSLSSSCGGDDSFGQKNLNENDKMSIMENNEKNFKKTVDPTSLLSLACCHSGDEIGNNNNNNNDVPVNVEEHEVGDSSGDGILISHTSHSVGDSRSNSYSSNNTCKKVAKTMSSYLTFPKRKESYNNNHHFANKHLPNQDNYEQHNHQNHHHQYHKNDPLVAACGPHPSCTGNCDTGESEHDDYPYNGNYSPYMHPYTSSSSNVRKNPPLNQPSHKQNNSLQHSHHNSSTSSDYSDSTRRPPRTKKQPKKKKWMLQVHKKRTPSPTLPSLENLKNDTHAVTTDTDTVLDSSVVADTTLRPSFVSVAAFSVAASSKVMMLFQCIKSHQDDEDDFENLYNNDYDYNDYNDDDVNYVCNDNNKYYEDANCHNKNHNYIKDDDDDNDNSYELEQRRLRRFQQLSNKQNWWDDEETKLFMQQFHKSNSNHNVLTKDNDTSSSSSSTFFVPFAQPSEPYKNVHHEQIPAIQQGIDHQTSQPIQNNIESQPLYNINTSTSIKPTTTTSMSTNMASDSKQGLKKLHSFRTFTRSLSSRLAPGSSNKNSMLVTAITFLGTPDETVEKRIGCNTTDIVQTKNITNRSKNYNRNMDSIWKLSQYDIHDSRAKLNENDISSNNNYIHSGISLLWQHHHHQHPHNCQTKSENHHNHTAIDTTNENNVMLSWYKSLIRSQKRKGYNISKKLKSTTTQKKPKQHEPSYFVPPLYLELKNVDNEGYCHRLSDPLCTSTNIAMASPQDHVNVYLQQSGYDTITCGNEAKYGDQFRRIVTVESGYVSHNPSPLQLASYGCYLVELILHNLNNDHSISETSTALREYLTCGVSYNPSDEYGDTLVHILCRRAEVTLLQVVLDVVASAEHDEELVICASSTSDPERNSHKGRLSSIFHVANFMGRTPLHEICSLSHASFSNSSPRDTKETRSFSSDSISLEAMFEVVDMILMSDPNLIFMADTNGMLPLECVHKEMWPEWISFLNDIKMKQYFSNSDIPLSATPSMTMMNTKSREVMHCSLYYPKMALSTNMASLVSSGKISPKDARLLLEEMKREKKPLIYISNNCGNSLCGGINSTAESSDLYHYTPNGWDTATRKGDWDGEDDMTRSSSSNDSSAFCGDPLNEEELLEFLKTYHCESVGMVDDSTAATDFADIVHELSTCCGEDTSSTAMPRYISGERGDMEEQVEASSCPNENFYPDCLYDDDDISALAKTI